MRPCVLCAVAVPPERVCCRLYCWRCAVRADLLQRVVALLGAGDGR